MSTYRACIAAIVVFIAACGSDPEPGSLRPGFITPVPVVMPQGTVEQVRLYVAGTVHITDVHATVSDPSGEHVPGLFFNFVPTVAEECPRRDAPPDDPCGFFLRFDVTADQSLSPGDYPMQLILTGGGAQVSTPFTVTVTAAP